MDHDAENSAALFEVVPCVTAEPKTTDALPCSSITPSINFFPTNVPNFQPLRFLMRRENNAYESDCPFLPIYEQNDFAGKMRLRLMRRKFKMSLAPLREVDIMCRDFSECFSSATKDRILCDFVCRNDIERVTKLLEIGLSPNCYDNHKRTPLHIAVTKGHCEMVKLLLKYGADPNIKDGLGNSCLHLTACTNNVEMASILIKGGASVNAMDIRGRSPIQLAQSKLRLFQRTRILVKSKVTEILDMLLLYLDKSKKTEMENKDEAELLSAFHKRLQITESPDEISSEVDNLSKVLSEMESLSLK